MKAETKIVKETPKKKSSQDDDDDDPDGAPGCLTGLTIVVTSILESLHREEAEGLVKKYGGKAPKAVSKNTT
ncbi:hypothetical protein DAPPUDRAFT_246317 [Daphnia pulex]|uniref:BRCT domain-containing protein n=1 Tax=Daphnia pulex TaxID=6669 RepID=E9GQ23_DAPPU|nr:hypothetical protein DAPPUDRAFT_246317 [Daphnia pulex]|eukprot:EFX78485.1 hypothetical protein DAPPUDRAFT_246317 [Daphnia pulex]